MLFNVVNSFWVKRVTQLNDNHYHISLKFCRDDFIEMFWKGDKQLYIGIHISWIDATSMASKKCNHIHTWPSNHHCHWCHQLSPQVMALFFATLSRNHCLSLLLPSLMGIFSPFCLWNHMHLPVSSTSTFELTVTKIQGFNFCADPLLHLLPSFLSFCLTDFCMPHLHLLIFHQTVSTSPDQTMSFDILLLRWCACPLFSVKNSILYDSPTFCCLLFHDLWLLANPA